MAFGAVFAAGAAIKGIGAIKGGRDARKAADRDAELLARESGLMRERTDEEIRRRELSDTQSEAMATALAAARGTGKVGESDQGYLDFMTMENERGREFDRQMGYEGADIRQTQASNVSAAGRDAQTAGYINAAGGAMSSWAAYDKWWG